METQISNTFILQTGNGYRIERQDQKKENTNSFVVIVDLE